MPIDPGFVILPYGNAAPDFANPPEQAEADAAVLGRVTVGRRAQLRTRSVLRADGHYVRIGDDVHIGARSTLHISHDVLPCIVGDRVAVGVNSCVHACTVGSDVAIGDNVVILDGATVEDNVILEPGTLVFPGRTIAGGFVYAGAPAKPVRPTSPEEVSQRRADIIAAGERAIALHSSGQHGLHRDSEVDPSVFIASTARVRGRLRAAAGSSIFFSNDLDAGSAVITIGANTNVQDNTLVRCTGSGVTIGHDTTVGHNVLLHDCVIGNHALIGIGSEVAPNTVVQDRVLLAAGARTTPGQVLESGFLYGSVPARKLAALDGAKQDMIAFIIWTYCQYAQDFKAAEAALASDAPRAETR